MVGVRIVALLLAFGGVAWGLLLWVVLFGFGATSPIIYLVVLPGYVITAGYIVRVLWVPPIAVRCIIWTLSAFVQFAWLMLVGIHELHLGTIWWLAATVASVWALRQEIQHESFDDA